MECCCHCVWHSLPDKFLFACPRHEFIKVSHIHPTFLCSSIDSSNIYQDFALPGISGGGHDLLNNDKIMASEYVNRPCRVVNAYNLEMPMPKSPPIVCCYLKEGAEKRKTQ